MYKYKITFLVNGSEFRFLSVYRIDAIKEYISLIFSRRNISELKIFKGDKDITIKVNKFIYGWFMSKKIKSKTGKKTQKGPLIRGLISLIFYIIILYNIYKL